MATIYWIAEKDEFSIEIWAFNKKRKAEEKAMELAPGFSSGEVDAGDCFILGRADKKTDVKGFNSVADAKAYAEKGDTRGETAGVCYPIKLKGGMGTAYIASHVEGSGKELFTYQYGELDRELNVGGAEAPKGKKVQEIKANIFWIAEKSGDYMKIFAFNNKRKAEKKAMQLSSDFTFGYTEIPKDGNEDGENWFYSGMINAKSCFLLYRENGMPHADGAFVDDAEASRWVEDKGYDAAGACFPVKLKGGMGEVELSSEADANGTQLWIFENGEVYEGKQTTTILESFKYVPTFESFIGSQELNEAKVKLGRMDAYNVDKHSEKWEAVLDILKGAIGKTISGADLKKVIGNQQFGQQDADNKAMKAAKVEITDVRIANSTFGAQWSIDYKYDTEFFGNNAGLKFKDIPGLDYEFATNDISIAPTPKGSKTLARVADMFRLGDIII